MTRGVCIVRVLLEGLLCFWTANACSYSESYEAQWVTMRSDDPERTYDGQFSENSSSLPWSNPGMLPSPLDMSNNAFISKGLAKPSPWSTSSDEYLLETLSNFAATQKEELCYWSYQPNPPPVDGPNLLHPYRKPWNIQDGHLDEDVEWGQALAQVAVSRLHSLVKPDGPVVNAICASGRELAVRRCADGRAKSNICTDPVLKQKLTWPMAVAIFKVGHPDLEGTITTWRSNASWHAPNIQWVYGAGKKPTHPWNNGGPNPEAGDVNPPGMPQGQPYPNSKEVAWGYSPGLSMLAKVVPCSHIPEKFLYPEKLNYCERMNEHGNQTTADESYDVWKEMVSVWPPTKQCIDDVAKLNAQMKWMWPFLRIPPWKLPMKDCASAKSILESQVPNFGCDTPGTKAGTSFRDMCCSVCGKAPVQILPSEPVPTPPPSGASCSVCHHVYDAEKDGNGKKFEDLPETWVCPQCGAPKSAYSKNVIGEWVHEARRTDEPQAEVLV